MAFARLSVARLAPAAFATVVASCALLAGCERQPSTDGLKDWAPTDHDRAEEQAAQAQPSRGSASSQQPPQARPTPRPRGPATAAGSSSEPKPAAGGSDATLVEATWDTACAPCHGPVGHGDGPNGPMVNAPDITRPELLAKVTDEEIAFQILNGKNRMPKFDLPEPVVRGLVARIRANRGR